MIATLDAVHASRAPRVGKPSPIEALKQTVSASRLNCWLGCRLKFFFRYVQQIRKPPTPALHVGTAVHAVLQAWNMARWRGQAFNSELFQGLFETDWRERQAQSAIKWDGEEDEQRNNTWALVQTYFAETPIKANERPEAVEVPMEAELPDGLPPAVRRRCWQSRKQSSP